MKDDVPEDVKKRRLQEIITTFYSHVGERHRRLVDTHQLVLVEEVRADRCPTLTLILADTHASTSTSIYMKARPVVRELS